MNKHAQQLGRLGRGKKKTLSPAEIKRRTAQLARVRARRWRKKRQRKPRDA
jgi:hypothetical protein